jgi:hypothetical protein
MVTNMGVAKCQGAQAAYLECTQYALQNLNLPNVAMYCDAGHAGWLGWPANLTPAAELFAKLYRDAGQPRAFRGFATNVANYNAWSLSSAPAYTTPNANFDEQKYINAFHPMLQSRGFDARFIVDQGMSSWLLSLTLFVFVPILSLCIYHTANTRIQAAVVNNQQARSRGATGATPEELALAEDPPLRLETRSLMPLSGSSQVVNPMALPTPLLTDTITTAVKSPLSSPPRKLVIGSR